MRGTHTQILCKTSALEKEKEKRIKLFSLRGVGVITNGCIISSLAIHGSIYIYTYLQIYKFTYLHTYIYIYTYITEFVVFKVVSASTVIAKKQHFTTLSNITWSILAQLTFNLE